MTTTTTTTTTTTATATATATRTRSPHQIFYVFNDDDDNDNDDNDDNGNVNGNGNGNPDALSAPNSPIRVHSVRGPSGVWKGLRSATSRILVAGSYAGGLFLWNFDQFLMDLASVLESK